MALGFSATLSTRKRLFFLPRPLEIERVLHALESIRNEDFGIPDLAVQRGIRSATRPTFTTSYLSEDGFLIVNFGGEAKIFFAVRDRDLYAEYVTTTLFGPGFHVLVLRFCERLAETAGLKLQIDDETDYYDNCDFASLKRNFVQWFGMLLQAVEQNQAGEEHYLCWALDSYHLNEPLPGVVTPAGFFRYEQLREMTSQLEQAADDFFLFLPSQRKRPCIVPHHSRKTMGKTIRKGKRRRALRLLRLRSAAHIPDPRKHPGLFPCKCRTLGRTCSGSRLRTHFHWEISFF